MKSYHVPELKLKGKHVDLRVPSSKSLANRAFVLAALSKGRFRIDGDFAAEDVQLMIAALEQLGISILQDQKGCLIDNDLSWMESEEDLELFLGNSGTCVRFLTTLVSLRGGRTKLTGKQRMTERPISDLVDALRELGVDIRYLDHEGFPPLQVAGSDTVRGGSVTIKGNISSQYITSLLLCAPAFEQGLVLNIDGDLISRPYVALSVALLKHWRVVVQWEDQEIRVESTTLKGKQYEVEGDASAAVYWWALAFLHNCSANVVNVPKASVQGDRKFLQLLNYFTRGKPCSVDGYQIDMNDMPDAAVMLMALAPLLQYPMMISGIASLRVKETDRISAMATELQKLKVPVTTGSDWMKIEPIERSQMKQAPQVHIDTYDDHRIAMAFGIIGTVLGNIVIMDPDCVSKSYPNFWNDLKGLY